MNNKQNSLSVTDEELAALDYYINYGHTQINMLCNLNSSNYEEMTNGRDFPKNKQEFLKMIERFVDIYSLILKLDEPKRRPALYRGSSNHDNTIVPKNAFISTSKNHYKATHFLSYSNSAVSTFSIPNDLPVLDIELIKHYYSDKVNSQIDEDEMLILPFAHVTSSASVKDAKANRTNYNITLAKTNLEPISQEELSQLQAEIADGCEQYLVDLKQEASDPSDIAYSPKKLSALSQKDEELNDCLKLSKSNDEFRKKLIKLVRGLCAQRELEINQAKEAHAKRMEEIQQELEAQKAQQLQKEANSSLHTTYQDLIQRFNSTPSQIGQLTQFNNILVKDIEAQANRLGILVNTDDIQSLNELFNRIQTELVIVQEGLKKASSFEDKEAGQAKIELDSLEEEERNPKYY